MSPEQIRNLIGKTCTFQHGATRLTGIIDSAKENGFAEPGHIPDAQLTIRGRSGKRIEGVSLVNAYVSFPENP